MTRILLSDVNKSYAASAGQAVKDVNIDIQTGEFFTLLGPSGCGKTTTLRMVAGFIRPTSGTIRFDDDDVTNRSVHKRGTGMVFQNYALFPHLTVAENVGYGLKVQKVGGEARDRRIAEALEQVHLEEYGKRRISELSGGQQQRVALARALVVRPRVLLLDEPLSNLDAKLRDETRREIRRVQSSTGTTAIYVTHDQAEAMAMSDRIAVMEAGHVHQIAAPRDLYTRPETAFVARFIGDANVLSATNVSGSGVNRRVRVSDGSGASIDVEAIFVDEPDESELLIAVRQEHVLLGAVDDADALPGTVVETEFTGMTTRVDVTVGDNKITAALRDDQQVPEVGSAVGVRFTPGQVRGVRA